MAENSIFEQQTRYYSNSKHIVQVIQLGAHTSPFKTCQTPIKETGDITADKAFSHYAAHRWNRIPGDSKPAFADIYILKTASKESQVLTLLTCP